MGRNLEKKQERCFFFHGWDKELEDSWSPNIRNVLYLPNPAFDDFFFDTLASCYIHSKLYCEKRSNHVYCSQRHLLESIEKSNVKYSKKWKNFYGSYQSEAIGCFTNETTGRKSGSHKHPNGFHAFQFSYIEAIGPRSGKKTGNGSYQESMLKKKEDLKHILTHFEEYNLNRDSRFDKDPRFDINSLFDINYFSLAGNLSTIYNRFKKAYFELQDDTPDWYLGLYLFERILPINEIKKAIKEYHSIPDQDNEISETDLRREKADAIYQMIEASRAPCVRTRQNLYEYCKDINEDLDISFMRQYSIPIIQSLFFSLIRKAAAAVNLTVSDLITNMFSVEHDYRTIVHDYEKDLFENDDDQVIGEVFMNFYTTEMVLNKDFIFGSKEYAAVLDYMKDHLLSLSFDIHKEMQNPSEFDENRFYFGKHKDEP